MPLAGFLHYDDEPAGLSFSQSQQKTVGASPGATVVGVSTGKSFAAFGVKKSIRPVGNGSGGGLGGSAARSSTRHEGEGDNPSVPEVALAVKAINGKHKPKGYNSMLRTADKKIEAALKATAPTIPVIATHLERYTSSLASRAPNVIEPGLHRAKACVGGGGGMQPVGGVMPMVSMPQREQISFGISQKRKREEEEEKLKKMTAQERERRELETLVQAKRDSILRLKRSEKDCAARREYERCIKLKKDIQDEMKILAGLEAQLKTDAPAPPGLDALAASLEASARYSKVKRPSTIEIIPRKKQKVAEVKSQPTAAPKKQTDDAHQQTTQASQPSARPPAIPASQPKFERIDSSLSLTLTQSSQVAESLSKAAKQMLPRTVHRSTTWTDYQSHRTQSQAQGVSQVGTNDTGMQPQKDNTNNTAATPAGVPNGCNLPFTLPRSLVGVGAAVRAGGAGQAGRMDLDGDSHEDDSSDSSDDISSSSSSDSSSDSESEQSSTPNKRPLATNNFQTPPRPQSNAASLGAGRAAVAVTRVQQKGPQNPQPIQPTAAKAKGGTSSSSSVGGSAGSGTSFASLFGGVVGLELQRAKMAAIASANGATTKANTLMAAAEMVVSLHDEAAQMSEQLALGRTLNLLEQREKIAEEMSSITSQPCTGYKCEECKRTFFNIPDLCKDHHHTLLAVQGVKRFFACRGCRCRVVEFNNKYPTTGCPKCGGQDFEAASAFGVSNVGSLEGMVKKMEARGGEVGKSLAGDLTAYYADE